MTRLMVSFLTEVKIYALRLILLASITSVIAGLVHLVQTDTFGPTFDTIVYLVVPGVTFLHHALSIIKWRFNYGIFDYLLLLCEIGATTLSGFLDTLSYLRLAPLCILCLYRTADIITTRGKVLITPFDFVSRYTSKRNVSSLSIVFGRIWESHISGEPIAIQLLRTLLAVVFILSLIAFTVYALIFQPLLEYGQTPVKTYRTTSACEDWQIAPLMWGIVASSEDSQMPVDKLLAAVTVTQIDDGPSFESNCPHFSVFDTSGVKSRITIVCKVSNNGDSSPDVNSLVAPFSLPDVLISVDFSALGITNDSLTDANSRTVSVYAGLTNWTMNIVENTIPIPLVPGLHLYGRVLQEIRRQYDNPSLAALGLFPTTRFFKIAKMALLTDDPSSLISRDDNTATLRLSGLDNYVGWTVVQDYREKSAVHNLASVGGFWTLVNGVFVIAFGCGLLHNVFRKKPISIFGVTHRLWRNRLREEILSKYPYIVSSEKALTQDERNDLFTFIREQVVDLDLIDNNRPQTDVDAGDDKELLPTTAVLDRKKSNASSSVRSASSSKEIFFRASSS